MDGMSNGGFVADEEGSSEQFFDGWLLGVCVWYVDGWLDGFWDCVELGDIEASIDGDADWVLDRRIEGANKGSLDGLSVLRDDGKTEGFADGEADVGWCKKDGDADKMIGLDVGDEDE